VCVQVDRPRSLLKVYSDRDWKSAQLCYRHMHTHIVLHFSYLLDRLTRIQLGQQSWSESVWVNLICRVTFSSVPNTKKQDTIQTKVWCTVFLVRSVITGFFLCVHSVTHLKKIGSLFGRAAYTQLACIFPVSAN